MEYPAGTKVLRLISKSWDSEKLEDRGDIIAGHVDWPDIGREYFILRSDGEVTKSYKPRPVPCQN